MNIVRSVDAAEKGAFVNNNGQSTVRIGLTALAGFNLLVGAIGGAAGLLVTAMMGLSVHSEDSFPPLGLAAACGMLGVAGFELMMNRRRTKLAAVWATVSVVAAGGGVAASLWRYEALQPSGGGMIEIGGLTALVGVVAIIEIAYLLLVHSTTDPAKSAQIHIDRHKQKDSEYDAD